MKKWLSYILTAVCCGLLATACTDELEGGKTSKENPVVRLKISLPGTSRAMGDYQDGVYTDNLDPETDSQRSIAANDIYVLQFVDGKLYHVVSDLTIDNNNGAAERTLTGHILTTSGTTDLVVLANLNQQDGITGITPSYLLSTYKDRTEAEIYKVLVYTYPGTDGAGWNLNNNKLPMWGKTSVTLNAATIDAKCPLYRSVAKMGVQVDDACTNFTLKEIYVYRVNDKGYCAPPTQTPSASETIQFTEPDIPADAAPLDNPLKYTVPTDASANTTYIEAGKKYLNEIYLSEVKNIGADADKQLKVVVGGIYGGEGLTGSNEMNYYRIDMMDDKGHTGTYADFDIIRNHSYIFNITEVSNPGTPTPDEALEQAVVGLKVVIEEWEDEYMRGVPDQYTLTTDKSVITCKDSKDTDEKYLTIWTDYSEGWNIVDKYKCDWFTISQEKGAAGEVKIIITPTSENYGVTREGTFYVMAGNIKKQITVIMPQPPTANCYLVGAGEHTLIVSIKGNGNDGIKPEGVDIVPGDGDASLEPDKIGIIWETTAGLVQLLNPDGSVATNTAGQLTLVDYDKTSNTIKYTVNITDAAKIAGAEGGNALIGAFDANKNVIWSWHIWVCPEMINPTTQEVKESMVENWTLNDYKVLDRNLGALSNRPIDASSVASMGLLYQWGRKDPFIGAGYSNDNFTGTGVMSYVWYYEDFGVQTGCPLTMNDAAINTTIAHPTHLVYGGSNDTKSATGLSSVTGYGGYLWGTNGGFSTTSKDLGSKTIYDPCPVGYRVPPVDAFVFSLYGDEYKTTTTTTYEKIEEITLKKGESKSYGYPIYYEYSIIIGTQNGTSEDGTLTYNYGMSDERTFTVYKIIVTTTTALEKFISSETANWRMNLIYVPHYDKDMKTTKYQWGDETNYSTTPYEGGYITDANYYGFYLNYTSINEPVLSATTASGTCRSSSNYGTSTSTVSYYYQPQTRTNISWLPLTGAYDPIKGLTFNGITIEQGSSITVNSFLWTNSTVSNGGPGAMFLHGTEDPGTGNGYNAKSGRHIHNLTDTEIQARPHYAGAVRCVRDEEKNKWEMNSLTATTTIKSAKDSETDITIISVNADWELVDPGADWLQVTPDTGTADKGKGSTITLKVIKPVDVGTQTTLAFRIANESADRKVTVTVVEK